MPFDPGIPQLGTETKDVVTNIWHIIYTRMVTAALFVIAKTAVTKRKNNSNKMLETIWYYQ